MRDLDYDKTINEIQQWIRDYVKNANVDGIVVGLSGGIDSAVTATLSVKSIGKEAVIGLGLPCLSIPKDLNDARILANFLGIRFIVIDLSSIFKEYINITSKLLKPAKIAEANLKARLRMISSYFVGQSLGKYLVGGTGNRTELAIGY
ncbi:MAG: NAD(+) synthase, partial [Candidatus Heimdallarchaeota archaeon]